MKKWMVTDSLTGIEEPFETEDEALKYADEILDDHRDAAKDEGWEDEVGNLRIYELKHKAQAVDRCGDEVDYSLMPLADA